MSNEFYNRLISFLLFIIILLVIGIATVLALMGAWS